MHMSLHELRMRSRDRRFSESLFKETLLCILQALDFLHREGNVVHTGMSPATADRREYLLEMTDGVTDIKATNIMLRIDDESILEDFEKAEQQSPSPEKVVGKNRTIYTSRRLRLPHDDLWGQPVLCDLGQARIGRAHTGLIQPEIYRAPEVLFDMGWGHSADIWNFPQAWDIFEGRPLFSALDEDQEYSPSHHVADGDGGCSWAATVVLHPAKPGNSQCIFRERSFSLSSLADQANDFIGEWLGEGGVTIPNTSLERLEEKLNGNGQQSFLQFTRSMLQWTPETRKTAKELLKDPWRNS